MESIRQHSSSSIAPEGLALQLDFLSTPPAFDPKIPFLHYLPILAEISQRVQNLQKLSHSQFVAFNPNLAVPLSLFANRPTLKINTQIEELLSLSMILAFRLCKVTLVMLPKLPSFRRPFHNAALKPFEYEAARYLKQIQQYCSHGPLAYLEKCVISTTHLKNPSQRQQQQQIAMNGMTMQTFSVSKGEMHGRSTVKDQLGDSINDGVSAVVPDNNDMSKAAAMLAARLAAQPPKPSPPPSPRAQELLDRAERDDMIAEKERAIFRLPLPNVMRRANNAAAGFAEDDRLRITETTTRAETLQRVENQQQHQQQLGYNLPMVVVTAPTILSSSTSSSAEVSSASTDSTSSVVFDDTAISHPPSTAKSEYANLLSSLITTVPTSSPVSPKVPEQHRSSVQSLIKQYESSNSNSGAESDEDTSKRWGCRNSWIYLPGSTSIPTGLEPSFMALGTTSHDGLDSQPYPLPSTRQLATTSPERSAKKPDHHSSVTPNTELFIAPSSGSTSSLPYHMRDKLTRKKSTRQHIRSQHSYQLSRLEDKKKQLSNVPIASRKADSSGQLDGDDVSSEEEKKLNKLTDAVDKNVTDIVERVEASLKLYRLGRQESSLLSYISASGCDRNYQLRSFSQIQEPTCQLSREQKTAAINNDDSRDMRAQTIQRRSSVNDLRVNTHAQHSRTRSHGRVKSMISEMNRRSSISEPVNERLSTSVAVPTSPQSGHSRPLRSHSGEGDEGKDGDTCGEEDKRDGSCSYIELIRVPTQSSTSSSRSRRYYASSSYSSDSSIPPSPSSGFTSSLHIGPRTAALFAGRSIIPGDNDDDDEGPLEYLDVSPVCEPKAWLKRNAIESEGYELILATASPTMGSNTNAGQLAVAPDRFLGRTLKPRGRNKRGPTLLPERDPMADN
ncbi:hypothetical protein BGX28_002203 [Mortierella sp. GBA30]|nr:hypothetical protein BGX28_002203 [Mortierella sp. GBA30]